MIQSSHTWKLQDVLLSGDISSYLRESYLNDELAGSDKMIISDLIPLGVLVILALQII